VGREIPERQEPLVMLEIQVREPEAVAVVVLTDHPEAAGGQPVTVALGEGVQREEHSKAALQYVIQHRLVHSIRKAMEIQEQPVRLVMRGQQDQPEIQATPVHHHRV
jgi:hypothetical protein